MKNRRRGPDFIINVIKWISIVIWIVIGIVLAMVVIMRPTSSGMQVSRVVQSTSSKAMTSAIFSFLVLQLILSVAGIVFNITRLKRKTDTIRLTLVFSGIFAIVGIIIISVK